MGLDVTNKSIFHYKHMLCNGAFQIPVNINHTALFLVNTGVQILSPLNILRRRSFEKLENTVQKTMQDKD